MAVDEQSYIVIVTRGHTHDMNVLEQALRTPARYVGLMASRTKRKRIADGLRDAGLGEADLARVHSPIGLAIGAETPAELAVSIVAEMIQVRAGRRLGDGATRRHRAGRRALVAHGRLKPLLPLGDVTVVARAVAAFLEAGISDVRVVVGWRGAEIGATAAELGVAVVVNEGWGAACSRRSPPASRVSAATSKRSSCCRRTAPSCAPRPSGAWRAPPPPDRRRRRWSTRSAAGVAVTPR